jgi:hypothetical protein
MATLSGCFLLDEFKESTATIANGSDIDITLVQIVNGASGEARRAMSYNVLGENEVLKPGEEIVLDLTPVLHEDSRAQLRIVTPDTDRDEDTYDDSYWAEFTYAEGADVVLTFDPSDSGDFEIENGELAPVPD